MIRWSRFWLWDKRLCWVLREPFLLSEHVCFVGNLALVVFVVFLSVWALGFDSVGGAACANVFRAGDCRTIFFVDAWTDMFQVLGQTQLASNGHASSLTKAKERLKVVSRITRSHLKCEPQWQSF